MTFLSKLKFIHLQPFISVAFYLYQVNPTTPHTEEKNVTIFATKIHVTMLQIYYWQNLSELKDIFAHDCKRCLMFSIFNDVRECTLPGKLARCWTRKMERTKKKQLNAKLLRKLFFINNWQTSAIWLQGNFVLVTR